MTLSQLTQPDPDQLAPFFGAVFGASEGDEEGRILDALTRDLLTTSPAGDLWSFIAKDAGQIIGAILFTRLSYTKDPRFVALLAPVAVATDRQRRGIGQALITHGLNAMRATGADIAVTYGDPKYYSQVGFQPVTIDDLPPPQPLSMPIGWQAQSLSDALLTPVPGPASCVPGFDDPAHW